MLFVRRVLYIHDSDTSFRDPNHFSDNGYATIENLLTRDNPVYILETVQTLVPDAEKIAVYEREPGEYKWYAVLKHQRAEEVFRAIFEMNHHYKKKSQLRRKLFIHH